MIEKKPMKSTTILTATQVKVILLWSSLYNLLTVIVSVWTLHKKQSKAPVKWMANFQGITQRSVYLEPLDEKPDI